MSSLGLRQGIIIRIDGVILIVCARCASMIIVTLIEIEAIEVIGNSTIIEVLFRHRTCDAMCLIRSNLIGIRVEIITVDDLLVTVSRGLSKDGTDTIWETCCLIALNPTILHITVTRISHTSGSERTHDTKIIDTAT